MSFFALASPQDLRAARMDREAVFSPESRGFQMAFAMIDATASNQRHPLAESIGRVANQIAESGGIKQ